MATRLSPMARKRAVLDAAIAVARRDGFQGMTREAVAAHYEVSPALVSYHLGTMTQLRRAVMRAAVAGGEVSIVADGLAARDPQAMKAPPALKRKAAKLLTS